MAFKTIPFTIDAEWASMMLLKLHFDKNYNFNDQHSKATRFALSEILYTDELSKTELDEIYGKYSDNHNLNGQISLTGDEEQIKEVFSYLFELDRFKKIHFANLLKGYGPYGFSVIDLRQRKEYEAAYTEHFETLLEIITENYSDEFLDMTQEERDKFILSNFVLIGKSKNQEWYAEGMRDHIFSLRRKKTNPVAQD